MDLYYTNEEEDFNLEESLLKAIDYHNSNEHSTTKYKPIDLRDTNDINLINNVKENMEKIIGKALKKFNNYLLEENDYLLIHDNIKIKDTFEGLEIAIKKKSLMGEFRIPAKIIRYTKDSKLKIKICKSFKNIVMAEKEYYIEDSLVREVSIKGFNYFMNL